MTHNGKAYPEVAYTRPIDPPLSRLLSSACDRWLRSRGLRVRNKFGLADAKKKTPPDLTLIPKSEQTPGDRA